MKTFVALSLYVFAILGFSQQSVAQTTMDKIMSEKKLVIGVAPWNRFVAINPKTNKFEGLIVDDINMMSELTGIEVELVNTNWGGLIAGLQAGKWDIIMTGMSATPERAMAVAFSEPFGFISVTAVVRADNKANSLEDLDQAGNTITVVSGTAQQKFAKKKLKNAKVSAFPDTGTAVLEVMNGRAAAYFGDSISNSFREKERPNEMRNVILGDDTEWNSLNHAVRYGDQQLLSFVNTYMRTMKLRGWYKDLAAKWELPASFATGP